MIKISIKKYLVLKINIIRKNKLNTKINILKAQYIIYSFLNFRN